MSGNISLKLHSADGRLVKTLIAGDKSAGVHTVNLDASGLANGTYFVVLRTNNYHTSRGLIVLH
ncbi:MAG: T9SS type A sorting domain-containing protein [candidate division WOR-3 bacterium]